MCAQIAQHGEQAQASHSYTLAWQLFS